MGALDALRRLAAALPLGETPPGVDPPRSSDDTIAALAAALGDETPHWSGWIHAGRGAGPDDGLEEAAAALTRTELVWVGIRPTSEPDRIALRDIERVMIEDRHRRVLLPTRERGLDSAELVVVFSYDVDLAAVVNEARRAPER